MQIIYFESDRCINCEAILPKITEVLTSPLAGQFQRLDATIYRNEAIQYGVVGTPALVVVNDAGRAQVFNGIQPVINKIDELLSNAIIAPPAPLPPTNNTGSNPGTDAQLPGPGPIINNFIERPLLERIISPFQNNIANWTYRAGVGYLIYKLLD